MSHLQINTEAGRTQFMPGETLAGSIEWSLDAPPRSVELALRWSTRGKGEADAETVASLRIDSPPPVGNRTFEFRLPDAPYSFEGKLISLDWELHLAADAEHHRALAINVAPQFHPIDLYAIGVS